MTTARKRDVRANEGKARLASTACCSRCRQNIASDKHYAVTCWRTPAMSAPAFVYFCMRCHGIDQRRLAKKAKSSEGE